MTVRQLIQALERLPVHSDQQVVVALRHTHHEVTGVTYFDIEEPPKADLRQGEEVATIRITLG